MQDIAGFIKWCRSECISDDSNNLKNSIEACFSSGDAALMLSAAELVLAYGIGKPAKILDKSESQGSSDPHAEWIRAMQELIKKEQSEAKIA